MAHKEDLQREEPIPEGKGQKVNGDTSLVETIEPHGLAELPPHRPHSLRELSAYLKEFLRPAYHIKKIKEDVRASIHSLRNRDLEILKDDATSLARAIRGRLLATYFLVGPFGILGPVAGTWFQFGIARAWPFASVWSFLVTIIIGNIFSAIGFQVIWSVSARTLYRRKPPAFFDWFLLWKDILPLQWNGCKRWAAANVVLAPLSMIALSLVDRFFPSVHEVLPIGVLTPMMEIIFVHTSLTRLMGDLFEKESTRITTNHAHPVEAAQG